jgi:cytochrome c oxidase assembly factor CtaG
LCQVCHECSHFLRRTHRLVFGFLFWLGRHLLLQRLVFGFRREPFLHRLRFAVFVDVFLGFVCDFIEATLFLVIVLISISSIGRILSWSISPLKCKDIGLLSIFMVYCILTKIVCIRFSLVLKMFTKRIELFLV